MVTSWVATAIVGFGDNWKLDFVAGLCLCPRFAIRIPEIRYGKLE